MWCTIQKIKVKNITPTVNKLSLAYQWGKDSEQQQSTVRNYRRFLEQNCTYKHRITLTDILKIRNNI